MKFDWPSCLLLAVTLSVGVFSDGYAAAWETKHFNPKPLPEDVILPMPCGGSMVFRSVHVPLPNPLDDYAITVGSDSGEWRHLEQAHPEFIAGSFTVKEPEPGRYYLMAKYEVTLLQYQAVMLEKCSTPGMKLLLPQTQVSWFDAVQFGDKYNIWLRKNAAASIPKEDGAMGFVRLPTEVEWEFAVRGGIKVSSADFREPVFPMPEGMNRYVWFSGPQSSNGKSQPVGLLEPNPLGLHDMLGNADEMVLEPFRLNKLNRLHGQAGGYTTRGGNYLTPQAEIRSAWRQEQLYYTEQDQNKLKAGGFRVVLAAASLTSHDRSRQVEESWNRLGAEGGDGSGEPSAPDGGEGAGTLEKLGALLKDVQDTKLKSELEGLRAELRTSNQARDEQRSMAIRSNLQLGAFLCTQINAEGQVLDVKARNYSKDCESAEAPLRTCPQRKQGLESSQIAVDLLLNIYADSLVDTAFMYSIGQVKSELGVARQQLVARQKNNLEAYLGTHWQHLQSYFQHRKINKPDWLNTCTAVAQTRR